jgi:peroxiredoxin
MNAITETKAAQPVALPRINEPAPAFDALTTHGRRKLADYRGKWLILFSHPADFTPVCSTEFIAFARRADDFAALDTELLGLSIDSHYAHIAWVRSIKETFGVEIPFPIIADLDMKVAQAYGMIQPKEVRNGRARQQEIHLDAPFAAACMGGRVSARNRGKETCNALPGRFAPQKQKPFTGFVQLIKLHLQHTLRDVRHLIYESAEVPPVETAQGQFLHGADGMDRDLSTRIANEV